METFEKSDDLNNATDRKHLIRNILLKLIFPAVFVILVTNLAFRGQKETDPKAIIAKAEMSGRFGVLREQYEKLIREDFFNIEYHRGYLRACDNIAQMRKYYDGEDEKKEYIEYSLDNNPKTSDIGYYGLGFFNALQMDCNSALLNYNKVRDSNLPFLNNSIGWVYVRLDDNRTAEKYFLREIEIKGNLEGAYSNLSLLFYDERNLDKLKEMVFDEKIKTYIPSRIIRIVNLISGRVSDYLTDIFTYEYITSYGFAAAVLILFVWFWYLIRLDVFNPEKWFYPLITLFGGMFFASLCVALYDFWDYGLHFGLNGHIVNDLLYCIFGIGLIEETVKIIPFLLVLRFSNEINESIDYVIYASVSALGFAFVENLLYFQEAGISSISGRALISVLLHISLSTFVAYGLIYSKYRKNSQRQWLYFAGSFAMAVVVHGLFDFGLIAEQLPSQIKLLSVFLLAAAVNKYSIIIKNTLNVSEFNSEYKVRIEDMSKYLVYSLSAIILLQYVLMAWKFGATSANLSLLKSIFLYYFMMTIIVSNLGWIEIKKAGWKGLFESEHKPSLEDTARKRALTVGIDFDDMKKKYDKWDGVVRVAILIFAALIIGGFYLLLNWIDSIRQSSEGTEYLITPEKINWLLPLLFLSIVLTNTPLDILFTSLLGRQGCRELDTYMQLKIGATPGKKRFRVMATVVIAANCIILPTLFDCYIKVQKDKIVVNNFWGYGAVSHQYKDIAELKLVKSEKTSSGGIVRSPHYEIVFADGYVFELNQGWHSLEPEKKAEIINYISKQCGKEIQEVDPYRKKSN